MQRSFLSALTLALVTLALAGCGSSNKSSAPSATGAAPKTTMPRSSSSGSGAVESGPAIVITRMSTGFKFSSSPVKAGSRVTVKNESDAQHTVSADTADGGFDLTIDPGATKTFTAPARRGVYGFHCNIHTYMKAVLNVT